MRFDLASALLDDRSTNGVPQGLSSGLKYCTFLGVCVGVVIDLPLLNIEDLLTELFLCLKFKEF